MNRRSFIHSIGIGLIGAGLSRAETVLSNRQVLELRVYHFDSQEKRDRFTKFIAEVAIPALNRIGIKPVGAWTLHEESLKKLPEEFEPLDLVILLPHRSVESVFSMILELSKDDVFISNAQDIVAGDPQSPIYKRFESSLHLAFEQIPKVEIPTLAKGRIAQLRIYESPNDERAIAKIHMFDQGGELRIFRKVGLTPVFFGQTIIGTRLPKLTYMLSFPDLQSMQKAWRTFLDDPEWKDLSQDQTYANTVSRIVNVVLQPINGSQI